MINWFCSTHLWFLICRNCRHVACLICLQQYVRYRKQFVMLKNLKPIILIYCSQKILHSALSVGNLFPATMLSQKPVLRIHDILVWIQIRGSMPLTNGSGSGSFYFHHRYWKCQLKNNCKKFFLHITSFFKGKKSIRSHITVEIKVLLTIFAYW